MTTTPDIRFNEIREHEGSQQRAWEELAYILAPDLDSLPKGTKLLRRGTPDGGIEFSCPAPDGQGVWAWQAKFLFDFKSKTFDQMRRSFEDALDNTPGLSKYIFVLPVDRPDGAVGISAMKKWLEHTAKWAHNAENRGFTVDLEFHGHSAVLKALLLPHHAGAAHYFFDAALFTPEVMGRQVSRAIDDLGQRYDPDLNVDTDIPLLVGGLCVDSSFTERVDSLLAAAQRRAEGAARAIALNSVGAASATGGHINQEPTVASPAGIQPVVDASDSRDVGHSAIQVLLPRLDSAIITCRAALDFHDPYRLDAVEKLLDECMRALAVDRNAAVVGAEGPSQAPSAAVPLGQRGARGSESHLQRAKNESPLQAIADAELAIGAAARFLRSNPSRAAERGALLLVGPAGCGKSHSLADVARTRVNAGAPTVLVLGHQLSINTSLGAEIGRFLQFDAPWKKLLGALEVAAQVAGKGRALLAIDAINEGPGADLWSSRIAGFVNEIKTHPMVSVLITVRDTYEEALIPVFVGSELLRAVHPGLAGHEGEAAQLYATHYGLTIPNVPMLNPEFTNPLLLKSLCRSAKVRGLDGLPATAMGENWVFDGLLEAVNNEVSAALDRDPHDRLVHRAVRAVAEQMLDTGSESILLTEARSSCRKIHHDHDRVSQSLLVALEKQGLLLRERRVRRTDGGGDRNPASDTEHIRFTYQRMSDHLRAQALLGRHVTTDELIDAIGRLIGGGVWGQAGLVEALSTLVPDQAGVELLDLIASRPWAEDSRYQLAHGLLDSLPWRASNTIGSRTVEIIRQLVESGHLEADDWLRALIGLACVPDHPLNIHFLHRRLSERTLVERDIAWTKPVVRIWQDEDNPLARTVDWLWGNCNQIDATRAHDASLLFAWLLSSTSRRLRDSATKVLVEISDTHPAALQNLLECFEDVNDPYIRERLLAVVFGHASRLPISSLSPTAAGLLSDVVGSAVRLALSPEFPPHALITHYVEQILHECSRRLTDAALPSFAEPATAWPLDPPSESELRKVLGDEQNKYLPSSPIKYDFREYILKRGIADEFVPPNQEVLRSRRKKNARARYRRAVNSLAAATGRTFEEVDGIMSRRPRFPSPNKFMRQLTSARAKPRRVSQLEQIRDREPELLRRAQHAKEEWSTDDPVRIDVDLLERFIIARALDLGWKPTNKNGPDKHFISETWAGQAQDKIERIGKKYSWIAFHELVAVLSQHCSVRRWGGLEAKYSSIWQLSYINDIDPSLTLRGDAPAPGSPSARTLARRREADRERAWWLQGFSSPLAPTVENDDVWLRSTADLPDPTRVLTACDPDGEEWIALELHTEWQVNSPGSASRDRPHRRDMWVRSQSYLAPASAIQDIRTWSTGKNWMGLWMPTPPDHGLGHYRQYPTGSPWSEWLVEAFEDGSRADARPGAPAPYNARLYDAQEGWHTPSKRGFPPHPIALATFGHALSADNDMSSKDLPRGLLPSPLILELLCANQTPQGKHQRQSVDRLGLGAVEREYTWSNDDGVVMFGTSGWDWGSPTALFIRTTALSAALESRGWAWWAWILGEKISWQHGDPTGDRLDIFGAAGVSDSALNVWSFDSKFLGFGKNGEDEE